MTTSQKRRKNPIIVKINTESEPIKPSPSEILLGSVIHEDLKWAHHIMHDKKSLIKKLTTRLNGLTKVAKYAPFKSRLMVANGIFMSKLSYCMPLWSGCEKYLKSALQIVQNKAARLVTNSGPRTPIKTMLKQCGWLSVNQLAIYHTMVLQYKTVQTRTPEYLFNKISVDFPYKTRLASTRSIRVKGGNNFQAKNNQLTHNSYRWRATAQWNDIPASIRALTKVKSFKKELRSWIQKSIEI